MYYTYVHYKKGTKEPFYIGKGKGTRHKQTTKRNQYWQRTVAKYGFDSEVLAHWNSEKDSLEHEKLLISCFRDLGYSLCNLTDGGEGSSGYKFTEEQVQNTVIANKAKAQTDSWKKAVSKGVSKKHKEDKEFFNKSINNFRKYWENPELNCNYKGKIIATSVEDNTGLTFNGQKELIEFGFQSSKVYACLSGRRNTHKGYTFKRDNKTI
jgi:hypothetical protein